MAIGMLGIWAGLCTTLEGCLPYLAVQKRFHRALIASATETHKISNMSARAELDKLQKTRHSEGWVPLRINTKLSSGEGKKKALLHVA